MTTIKLTNGKRTVTLKKKSPSDKGLIKKKKRKRTPSVDRKRHA